MTEQTNPAAGKYPIAVAALGVLLAGTFMPSPLYELYRRSWHLTPAAISFVFAIYAGTLIPSLLFLGGISDRIGRRRTLLIALGIAALGSLVFACATGLWWLVAARMLQGLAIGIGTGTATAAIREWMDDEMRPRAGAISVIGIGCGSALGALIGGSLAQYAPLPTTLPYVVHIVLLAAVAAALATVPSCPHLAPAGHSALPTIPEAIVRPFYLASLSSFVGWATIAIFVSLLPTFLIRSLDVHNLLVGSAVVVLLQIGMISASVAGRRFGNRMGIVAGMLALGGGVWLLLAGVPLHGYALIVAATLVVGFGAGLSYVAGLNIVAAISPPDHRAALLSAFFVACYLGFSAPALGVGIAANRVGLYAAIAGAAILLGVLAVAIMAASSERNLRPVPRSQTG